MKSLKVLLFVATTMLISGTSWAMEGKVATAAATTVAPVPPATAIVECKTSATTQTPSSILSLAKNLGSGAIYTAKAALWLGLHMILHDLSHEGGHVVMAILCGADPQGTSIFLYSDVSSASARIKYNYAGPYYIQPSIKLGFIYSYLDSINSYANYGYGYSTTPDNANIKQLLVSTAGGCTGLLFLYAKLVTQAFAQEYTNTKNLKKAAAFAITRAHTPYQNILEQPALSDEQVLLRVGINTLILISMLGEACYAFLPDTGYRGGDGNKAWSAFLRGYGGTFVDNNYIEILHTMNIIRESLFITGAYLIAIKSINCLNSYLCGEPFIQHNVLLGKVGKSIIKVGKLILWEKVLKPQLTVLAWERRLINNFVYDNVLAPAGNKLQQAGSWTKQKSSQILGTIRGWFSCGKPKVA